MLREGSAKFDNFRSCCQQWIRCNFFYRIALTFSLYLPWRVHPVLISMRLKSFPQCIVREKKYSETHEKMIKIHEKISDCLDTAKFRAKNDRNCDIQNLKISDFPFGEHYKTQNWSISVACGLLESTGMSILRVKFHRTIRFRKPMTGFNSAQKISSVKIFKNRSLSLVRNWPILYQN